MVIFLEASRWLWSPLFWEDFCNSRKSHYWICVSRVKVVLQDNHSLQNWESLQWDSLVTKTRTLLGDLGEPLPGFHQSKTYFGRASEHTGLILKLLLWGSHTSQNKGWRKLAFNLLCIPQTCRNFTLVWFFTSLIGMINIFKLNLCHCFWRLEPKREVIRSGNTYSPEPVLGQSVLKCFGGCQTPDPASSLFKTEDCAHSYCPSTSALVLLG